LEDIDKNKDGVISLEEYIGMLKSVWLYASFLSTILCNLLFL